MFFSNIKRAFKYGVYGSVAIGGSIAGMHTFLSGEFDYESIGIVRISRTAKTALDIGRTYQDLLYSKNWDKDSDEYLKIRSKAHKIGAEKLLELCQTNKGVYIKVGQHIGALDYIIPEEYVSTMRILHRNAPKNTVEECYKVIEKDLKKHPDTIFDEFEPEPLGVASLAQVHKAKLKDGTVVAVKVQHAFVKKNINIDLYWMSFILKTMEVVFPEFQMKWLIEETKTNINKELDFIQEGKNAEKVAGMFKSYEWLRIPKIFWEYSTPRVLVMEYMDGSPINDVQYIEKNKIDKIDVCTKLGDLYSHMIFITGFVHSDPHPGNILVKKNPHDKNFTISLIDHGLYATLPDEFRYHYSKLWLAIISQNREEMRLHSKELGINKDLYPLFACIVSARPWDIIMSGITRSTPDQAEKESFQKELPKVGVHITHVLEQMDRKGLLVLKTNDLIRSIEYTLGTKDKMCGFLVMSKCCTQCVYQMEYPKLSMLKKKYLTLKYQYAMFMIYCYGLYNRVLYLLENIFFRPQFNNICINNLSSSQHKVKTAVQLL